MAVIQPVVPGARSTCMANVLKFASNHDTLLLFTLFVWVVPGHN